MNQTVPSDAAETTAPTSQAKVRAGLLTIQVLFGINYLASKVIVTAMSPAAWAVLRTSGAFLVLALVAAVGRRRLPPRRDLWLLAVCALFGVVFNQGFFLEGLSRTTVGHSALICSQIPTFVLLFSVLARQEILTWRKALGFAAGIAGVLVLLGADRFTLDQRYLTGDLLTLTNAASYAMFVVLSRRVMARNDPLAATTVIFFFGALGMMIYGGSSLLATDFSVVTPQLGGVMVYVILGATVVTYFLNLWAVKRVQATRVALYIFLQPVIAAVLGIAFRGENLTPRFLVATVLVFTALLLRDGAAKAKTAR
ncbi:MAG: DMT family transporter [Candidatus Krumholzibacteriota bacterium]